MSNDEDIRHRACDAFGPGDRRGFRFAELGGGEGDYVLFSHDGRYCFTSYATLAKRTVNRMALLFLIVGALALITAIKGNVADVARQLEKDFVGRDSFWLWVGFVLLLSILGSALNMREASRMFMILVVVVYLISRNGVFTKFEEALNVTAPGATPQTDVGQARDAHNQGAQQ
jgi:hypothetical protein